MNALLAKLNPSQKRMLVIGLIVGAIILLGVIFMDDDSKDSRRVKREEDVRAVLTSRDSRNVGLESLAAKQRQLDRRSAEIERQFENMRRDARSGAALTNALNDLQKELGIIKNEMAELSRENERLAELASSISSTDTDVAVIDEHGAVFEQEVSETIEKHKRTMPTRAGSPVIEQETVENIFSEQFGPTATYDAYNASAEGEGAKKQPLIRSVKNEIAVVEEANRAEKDSVYLPVGSIITGVLINGLDAPTGAQARNAPFPATLRVQHEAILPNYFSSDIRECFIQVAGYGDMSSERAYMRAENISCVREDGGVIESRLDAYAVGEDGKTGIRGRLVSREGQLLARSLTAGFLEGVAGAFNVQAAPSLRIDSTDKIPIYKQTIDADRFQGGVAGGAGNALQRLADYYMDMAESIFPVIEIDAGRQIDLIINGSGTALRVKGNTGN